MPKMSEEAGNIDVVVFEDGESLARAVAKRIARLVQASAKAGKQPVLGLPTGSTPLGVYRELCRAHREGVLDFSNVVTFNVDEYYPMDPGSPHSFHRYMWDNLFSQINVAPENIHIPRGDVPKEGIEEHCRAYEESIARFGGIDFQILGIGRNGHIAFNEPGSNRESRTRLVTLHAASRQDVAPGFSGQENVPMEAITMGMGTILDAREIVLLAIGEHKADIVRRALEEPVTPEVTASFLQVHPNVAAYLDPAAASNLAKPVGGRPIGEADIPQEREMGS
jgi:glucosamine-6-phosphate deaminase